MNRSDDSEILARYGIAPDPVIEAYKKDIDRTLLRENLKLSVGERIDRLQEMYDFALELRGAGRKRVAK